MDDLHDRLLDLQRSLGEFKPTDRASWQTALIFNALLGEVKKAHPDDPIIGVIGEAQRSQTGNATADCGTLRTAVTQMVAVTQPEHGPLVG